MSTNELGNDQPKLPGVQPGQQLRADDWNQVVTGLNNAGRNRLATGQVSPSPKPAGEAGFFPVKLMRNGGTQGTAATPPTWTYDVLTLDGSEVLLENVPPQYRPTDVGQYLRARNNDIGIAYRDESGAVVLTQYLNADASCFVMLQHECEPSTRITTTAGLEGDGTEVLRCGTGAELMNEEGRFLVHEYQNPTPCCEDEEVQTADLTVDGSFGATLMTRSESSACGVTGTFQDLAWFGTPTARCWEWPNGYQAYLADGGTPSAPATVRLRTDPTFQIGNPVNGYIDDTLTGDYTIIRTAAAPLMTAVGGGFISPGACGRETPADGTKSESYDQGGQAGIEQLQIGTVRLVAAIPGDVTGLSTQQMLNRFSDTGGVSYVLVTGGVLTLSTSSIYQGSVKLFDRNDGYLLPAKAFINGLGSNQFSGTRGGSVTATYIFPSYRATYAANGQSSNGLGHVQRTGWATTGTLTVSGWADGVNFNLPGLIRPEDAPGDAPPQNGTVTEYHTNPNDSSRLFAEMRNGRPGFSGGAVFVNV